MANTKVRIRYPNSSIAVDWTAMSCTLSECDYTYNI